MPLFRHIEVDYRDDVAVLRILDARPLAQKADQLSDEIMEFVELYEPTNLIVDFGKIEYFSTTVVNALLMAARNLAQFGGRLKLCSVDDDRRLIRPIAAKCRIFDVHETLDDAMAAFRVEAVPR